MKKKFLRNKIAYVTLVLLAAVVSATASNAASNNSGSNLIANPSVEEAGSISHNTYPARNRPSGWNIEYDSTNQKNRPSNRSYFYYPTPGHNGKRSITVRVFSYRNPENTAGGWYFDEVDIDDSKQYLFSDYYRSSATSYITADFRLSNGEYITTEIGKADATRKWKKFETVITAPAGTVSMTVIHHLESRGWLSTDDYYLGETEAPPPPPPPPPPPSDTTPPVITLLGLPSLTLWQGHFYIDAGATATDNVDGDITSQIRTNNPINTSVPGTYYVSYNVSDSAGNVAMEVKREIIVKDLPSKTDFSFSGNVFDKETLTPIAGAVVKLKPMSYSPPGPTEDYVTTTDANGHFNLTEILGYIYSSGGLKWVHYAPYAEKPGYSNFISEKFNFSENKDKKFDIYMASSAQPSDNLILNPSFESGVTLPDNWNQGSWGANGAVFLYPAESRSGQTGAFIRIQSSYVDGDAKWYFDDVAVTPGEKYVFSNYYKSTVPTRVTARFTLADGTFLYLDFGYPQASSEWTQFSHSFTAPQNAVSLTVFHLIEAVGWLAVDDFSLVKESSSGNTFNQGMVTLSFDDGWLSTYQNGLPILSNYGIKSTQYIFTDALGTAGYITSSQMLDMQNQGHEIGAHSLTHSDLTTLTDAQIANEILGSKQALQALGVNTITSFAYPYGEWNENIKNILRQSGYQGARTAMLRDGGFNYANQDPYLLRTFSVEVDTPVSEIQQWLNQAVNNKTWAILVFHQIENGGGQYSTTPQNLNSVASYISANNIKTVTIGQGLSELNR